MKLLTLLFLLSNFALAHEDHGAPGSLPPAPNGGILEEAQHMHQGSHKHNHKNASEREIFFEGKFVKGTLQIFPLELEPKGHKHFLTLKTNMFKDLKIEVNDPRKKMTVSNKFESEEKKWFIDVSKYRARRFIVHISGIYKGAKYQGEVQIEKK